ncbi:kinase-like protein [Aspergillus homomorphus CBS 101889]|uniref:Kinase-like protein n=1 Tax=Aspergillus homomorphus (strain CBS 101889) TaxID=1450537 RepID=A0A395IC51_ASPHC|nr:kinase-like protein [Aspergillus homomorphus CBS 101889]RAL17626.1 kinase-like protein [Aspergillus homomorphus CBS 101889]
MHSLSHHKSGFLPWTLLQSLLRSLPQLGRRWKPLNFSNPNYLRIPGPHKIEEETLPDHATSQYYPTQMGEIIKERYQVIGKSGDRRDVMLKIFIQASSMGQQVVNELNLYRHMEHTATAILHQCLVHPPLWESVLAFLRRNPVERLPSAVIAVVLHRLFLALDYLHTDCNIAHIDIKADNIMFGIEDDSVFTDFEIRELERSVPRKEANADGRTIYMSQELKVPKQVDRPVLCDFGSAMLGECHSAFVQPKIYRAPEVIFGAPWTFSADIWNVGCMGWDIYDGGSLFTGQDPDSESLLTQGELKAKFFSNEGKHKIDMCRICDFLAPDLLT